MRDWLPEDHIARFVVCLAYNMKRLFNLLKASGDWHPVMAQRVIEC